MVSKNLELLEPAFRPHKIKILNLIRQSIKKKKTTLTLKQMDREEFEGSLYKESRALLIPHYSLRNLEGKTVMIQVLEMISYEI